MRFKKPSKKLFEYLELWGFDDEILIYKDGSFGFVLELNPIDCSCFDQTEMQRTQTQLRPVINALPKETYVQFITRIEPHESLTDKDELTKFRNQRIANKLIVKPRFYLLVRTRPHFTGKVKPSESNYRSELEKTRGTKNQVQSLLQSAGLPPISLTCADSIKLIFEAWNPGRMTPPEFFRPGDISQQILLQHVSIDPSGFSVGNKRMMVLSLKSLPEATFFGQVAQLRQLPVGSTFYLSLFVPDQQKEMDRLKQERRFAFSHSNVTGFLRNIESQTRLDDTEQLISELLTSDENLLYMSVNITCPQPDRQSAEACAASCLEIFRSLSGTEGINEDLASFPIFSEIAIPHAKSEHRRKRVKTTNLIDFLPVLGPWKGHKSPRCHFETPAGTLIGFDPFSGELANSNMVISGMSGSGKSFLCNSMILEFNREAPKTFILDVGGSYRKLCSVLHGEYHTVSLGSGFALNPFGLAEGENAPSPMKIKFLLGLIELMTKEEKDRALGRLERASLEQEIRRLYELQAAPTLSDFRRQLELSKTPDLQQIAKILSLWTGNSPYGKIFDVQSSTSLSADLVCFDLQGLKAHPDLQAVCLYAITDLIWREILQDKARTKYVFLDECWELLQSRTGAQFVSDMFRTARKHNGSCIAISQSISDFEGDGRAILTNSATKFVLAQRAMEQTALTRTLQLNSNECEIVSSLRKSNGRFTQALFLCGDRHTVCEIVPSPTQYWICTTDPQDLAEERKRIESGLTVPEAIRALAKQFPHGIRANTKE